MLCQCTRVVSPSFEGWNWKSTCISFFSAETARPVSPLHLASQIHSGCPHGTAVRVSLNTAIVHSFPLATAGGDRRERRERHLRGVKAAFLRCKGSLSAIPSVDVGAGHRTDVQSHRIPLAAPALSVALPKRIQARPAGGSCSNTTTPDAYCAQPGQPQPRPAATAIKHILLLPPCSLVLSIWLCANDAVFNNVQVSTPLHVVSRGMYWITCWTLV
jgi:hypothetical protein